MLNFEVHLFKHTSIAIMSNSILFLKTFSSKENKIGVNLIKKTYTVKYFHAVREKEWVCVQKHIRTSDTFNNTFYI